MDKAELSSVFHSSIHETGSPARKQPLGSTTDDATDAPLSAFATSDLNLRDPLLGDETPTSRPGELVSHSSATTRLLLSAFSSRKLSAKLRLFDKSSADGDRSVWGWLEPGSRVLSSVVLRGDCVAVGRGYETFSSERTGSEAPASLGAVLTDRLESSENEYAFIEVPDGRVSRLHCTISRRSNTLTGALEPVLEDLSSNGTFVNGKKVGLNKIASLKEGDRVSLVLSVAPLVEQYFIFHAGDSYLETTGNQPADGTSDPTSPVVVRSSSSLRRMSTNQYTTADQSSLDDLQCQICLGTLRQCVALEPCGHNFCAVCMSHHFASLLQSGQPISCPLRCTAPTRVVVNPVVRDLVKRLGTSVAQPKKSISFDRAISHSSSDKELLPARVSKSYSHNINRPLIVEEEEADYDIHPLCPLYDDMLPVDASNLKSKQLQMALLQLRNPSSMSPEQVMVVLEALARLSWSDDAVRKAIADNQGIESIVACMNVHKQHEGVQCNSCLALMALVRGEGDVCVHNQWRVAKCSGVAAIRTAMRNFRTQPMVQLSAMLCLIPLSLENQVMQAHIASVMMSDIVEAVRMHPNEVDIQAKGLVALGVMAQGEDVIHDAIRQLQLDAGVPATITSVLQTHGRHHDEALWAALFSLAVLVREGCDAGDPTAKAMATAGVVRELKICMTAYKERVSGSEDTADEMIVTAGEFLQKILEPAQKKLQMERGVMVGLAFALPVSCVMAACALRYWRLV